MLTVWKPQLTLAQACARLQERGHFLLTGWPPESRPKGTRGTFYDVRSSMIPTARRIIRKKVGIADGRLAQRRTR